MPSPSVHMVTVLGALLTAGACSSPDAASGGLDAGDAGAPERDLGHLLGRDAGAAEPVDVIGLESPDAGAESGKPGQLEDAHVADAGELEDGAQGVDAGPVHPCDPGRIDCDGVAANGCELLAWDAGCVALSANGKRCVDCAEGVLCACGVLSADPKCVTICD